MVQKLQNQQTEKPISEHVSVSSTPSNYEIIVLCKYGLKLSYLWIVELVTSSSYTQKENN